MRSTVPAAPLAAQLIEAWRINNRINLFLIDRIKAALEASGAAIERLVERGLENGGVLKGFKRGVVPALAYLIAHDSHHRGSVLLTLKLSGHKVDTATQYGIWEWEKR